MTAKQAVKKVQKTSAALATQAAKLKADTLKPVTIKQLTKAVDKIDAAVTALEPFTA